MTLLPVGGTYTLDAAQAAKLTNTIKPEFVIPVHYGSVVGKAEDADDLIRQLDRGIQAVVKINLFGK